MTDQHKRLLTMLMLLEEAIYCPNDEIANVTLEGVAAILAEEMPIRKLHTLTNELSKHC